MDTKTTLNEIKCPACQKGNLYNTWDSNYGKWREQCYICNFSRLHNCRRKMQVNIDFEDRRMDKMRILHDFKRIANDLSRFKDSVTNEMARFKDDIDRLYEDVEKFLNGGNNGKNA